MPRCKSPCAACGFAALPDEQRAGLLLVGVKGLSSAEAARVLGVLIGTAMRGFREVANVCGVLSVMSSTIATLD